MMDKNKADTFTLLEDLLKKAKECGATDADAVLSDSTSVSITRRMGKPEAVSRSEEADIGLRVFVGKKQASVSSSDRSPEALAQMAERAVAMAKCVPDDIYAGIADPKETAENLPFLDLYDTTTLSMAQMNDMADAAEQAALAVKGITNSEGAECGYGTETSYLAATNGFMGAYDTSGFHLSVSVIAGKDVGMETDYAYDSSVFLSDMKNPADIGREAGERSVAALNPSKGKTRQMPVILDRRIAGSLIGALAQAASGSAVAKGTTLLKDKMGAAVFSSGITIVDDPFRKRGARSKPFDGEGVAPQKRNIIDNGVLTGWLLDLASARQLGLVSTGNGGRGGSSPRPSNFYMKPGNISVQELIADIDEGFFITQFLGSGGSTLTGDYSRGAKGFWIEKGKIAHPVSEMTIAGNLKDMWLNVTPANDLDIRYGTDAPTLLINGMTVAGG